MNLQSSGECLYKIEVIITLIPTDLPEPVVPAINKWGIFSRFANTALPLMSLPSANIKFFSFVTNFSFLKSSLKYTGFLTDFGIYIQITFLTGIIATLADIALIFLAISSDNEIIFEALIPGAGCNSYIVTMGPG